MFYNGYFLKMESVINGEGIREVLGTEKWCIFNQIKQEVTCSNNQAPHQCFINFSIYMYVFFHSTMNYKVCM